jgi:hypothetical protein
MIRTIKPAIEPDIKRVTNSGSEYFKLIFFISFRHTTNVTNKAKAPGSSNIPAGLIKLKEFEFVKVVKYN